MTAPSQNGSAIPVVYSDPTVTGGASPLTVACTPVSGATYQLGTTSVSCNVTDAQKRSSSCTFAVTVFQPVAPHLSVTKFVAFGDSITAGEIPDNTDTSVGFRPFIVQPLLAYPHDLQGLLQQRYYAQTQTISVVNSGVSLETTTQGLARLPGVLAAQSPDVLLLLEGVNDLDGTDASQQTALSNLKSMILSARGHSARVIVATLPPQYPSGCSRCRVSTTTASWVQQFNPLLTSMALNTGAQVVDMYGGLSPDLADWISPLDGLHPTAAGYQQMAQLFFAQIKSSFEATPTASSPVRTGSSATPAAAGRGSPSAAPARPAVRGIAAPSRGKSR